MHHKTARPSSASLDRAKTWDAVLLSNSTAAAPEVANLGGDAVAHAWLRAHRGLTLESVERLYAIRQFAQRYEHLIDVP